MCIGEALVILVEDWQARYSSGKTSLSVETVMESLGGNGWQGVFACRKPHQVAGLIMADMTVLGTMESAVRSVAAYRSKSDLLSKKTLSDFLLEHREQGKNLRADFAKRA